MNQKKRFTNRILRYCAGLMLVVLLLANLTQTYAGTVFSKETAKDYLQQIATYELTHIKNPTYGSVEGEWAVMGLARYGAVTDTFLNTYKNNLKKYLSGCNGVLSNSKYTEYARVVIALTAIEENPKNFGGYNLLKPLAEYEKVIRQGMNGIVYTLIALDCGGYDIPEPDGAYTGKKTTRERLVNAILANQTEDGGWCFGGKTADTDMTAMTLQALAPYMKEDKVKKAAKQALDRLGELQQKDGSYCSGSTKTCESTAQVLTALAVTHTDISDARFVKGGNTILDGLMQYYKSGGFAHSPSGDVNGMATEQAMYALTAYYRKVAGRNGLYEMKDGMTRIDIKIGEDKKETTTKKTGAQGAKKKQTSTPETKTTTKKSKESGQSANEKKRTLGSGENQTSSSGEDRIQGSAGNRVSGMGEERTSSDADNQQTVDGTDVAGKQSTRKKKPEVETIIETIVQTDATGETHIETVVVEQTPALEHMTQAEPATMQGRNHLWNMVIVGVGIIGGSIFLLRHYQLERARKNILDGADKTEKHIEGSFDSTEK